MSLQFSLVASQIKHFKSMLQCLAKIGTELLIEAFPERIVLRSINTSQSAYLEINLAAGYFDAYQTCETVFQVVVEMKAARVVFRSTKIARVSFEVEDTETQLTARVFYENGLKKTYGLPCLDTEILNSNSDASTYQTRMLARADDLQRLLANFQSNSEQVTMIAHPDTNFGSLSSSKSCELRNYHDPTSAERKRTLETELAVDAQSVFLEYHNSGKQPVEGTFNVKDLRAFVSLCAAMSTDVCLRIDAPGKPLFASLSFPVHQTRGEANLERELEAKLILATLAESTLPPPVSQSAERTGPGGSIPSYQSRAYTTIPTNATANTEYR